MISSQKKIKRLKIGKKKVLIIFEDEDKLQIQPNVYTEFNLFPGKILSKKNIKEIKQRNDLETFLSYAINLCSSKSYSKHQIEEKLIKKGANSAQIEQIIETLIKYQLLDEKSLVKEILDYCDYKHFGYLRIKDEMFKKGISSKFIDQIEYDEDRDIKQAKNILKELESKYSKYNYSLMKQHIYQALLRLGYSYEVANLSIENVSEIDVKKEKQLLQIDYQKAYRKYKGKYNSFELNNKINQYLIQKGYRYSDIQNIKRS